jgi:hypothetical protein
MRVSSNYFTSLVSNTVSCEVLGVGCYYTMFWVVMLLLLNYSVATALLYLPRLVFS